MTAEYSLVLVGLSHFVLASIGALAATYTRPRTPGRRLSSIFAATLTVIAAVNLIAAALHPSRNDAAFLIFSQVLISTAILLILRRSSSGRIALIHTASNMRQELEKGPTFPESRPR